MTSRLLPAQMASQIGHRSRQSRADPRPGCGLRHGLDAHSTARTAHATWPIAQHHGKLAQREVAPASDLFYLVNPLAGRTANPASQPTRAKTVNLDYDLVGILPYRHDVMNF